MDDIPLFEIAWDERDVANVVKSVSRGGYWAKGPFVTEFEDRIADQLDVEHVVTVNSGTSALVAGLRGLGVGPGDEVIVPSFTFIATANAVRLVGATPVFADIERETYGLDPDAVAAAVTDSTAAIVPVHPYGSACRIDAITDIAADADIAVLEDAAEVFGATVDGQPVGTHGDAAVLSFCQNKIVATGEGGAVVTDDDEIAAEARLYRSHGRASDDYFDSAGSGEYVSVGTNLRMPDIVAALGCSQIEKVEELIEGRQAAARRTGEALADVEGVHPHTGHPNGTHVYQLYTVTLEPWIDRQQVIEVLANRGISSKVYWDPPVHRTSVQESTSGSAPDLPVTNDVASRVLSLPIHPNLSPEESRRIGEGVRAAVAEQF